MFYRLIDEVGFRWSVRILGFTALATLILPVVVMQQRFKPQQARALLDLTTFTDLHFMIFSFGTLVGFTGVYVAVFYLSYCGLARGLTDPSLSFYLVAIFNAGSVVGRIVPNWASDKIGPFNVIVPGAVVSGILMLCLLAVNSAGGIIAIAVLLGISTGIFIALPGVLFNALSPDKSKVGTRIGMGFAFFSPAVFLGGPAAGAILGDGTANLHWSRMWIYGGVMLLAASIPFLYLRMARAGWKIKAKL